jgi:DNA-binding beta-propeller fold protein YncE
MKTSLFDRFVFLRVIVAAVLLASTAAHLRAADPDRSADAAMLSSADAAPLELIKKIDLAGGAGRLDHFGFDADHDRLFASNRSDNSLDVVDLHAGKLLKQIPDQKKIHGIAYAPNLNRIFVGNGDPGVCNIFDGQSYELLKSLPIPKADNVQFDPRTNLVFVGHDGLTVIDAGSMSVKAEIAMPGILKAIRIDPARPRLYANSTTNEVCVVDTDGLQIAARYPITSASGNAALAVDAGNRRLFVGCRKEPKLVVLDADTGREITSLDIPANVDDLSFDAKRQRIYASSGEGVLAVIQQTGADQYSLAAKIPTAKQAQTSLFDPTAGRLYVGVPRQEAKDGPEIWVYQARP